MILNKMVWDSNFFDVNIAELKVTDNFIDEQLINDFAAKNDIKLLQSCCLISNTNHINKLELYGFNFIDLRFELEINLKGDYCNSEFINKADEVDIPAIIKISDILTQYSRFKNSIVPQSKIKEFYSVWAEKSVLGTFDDVCLKYTEGNDIRGFITVKYLKNGTAKIGLVCVDDRYHNCSIGSKLIDSLFFMLKNEKITTCRVACQGQNTQALNFYIRKGFNISNILSWYYKYY